MVDPKTGISASGLKVAEMVQSGDGQTEAIERAEAELRATQARIDELKQ